MTYSQRLLDKAVSAHTPIDEQGGYADSLLQETVQRHFEPTEERTAVVRPGASPGDPIPKFTGKGGRGASYWTHTKQGFVDKPFNKVRIYAADRFPELDESERLSRYKIQDGEVIYKADDNKWYSESPDLFPYKLKKFLGETTAHSPSIVLGTLGEFTGGAPGAVAGAAAGESIRQNIGAYAFGEQEEIPSYLKEVGKEGVLGGIGSLPGRGSVRILRKAGGISGGGTGRRIVKAVGPELPTINFKKAAKLQKSVKKEFGVDLFDAQTTESRRLLNRLNLYGDLPETSDLVQIAKKIQDDKAFKATDDYFDALYDVEPEHIKSAAVKMDDGSIIPKTDEIPVEGVLDGEGYVTNRGRWLTKREAQDVAGDPNATDIVGRVLPGTDPLYAGQKVTDAAKKAIDREINARIAKARPYYKKAFAKKTKVDIQPHINELDEMIRLTPETSPRRKALSRYKRMLHRTTKVEGKDYLIPESRIEHLDEIKKSTDELINSFKDAPISNRTKKDIRTIKNNILDDLDDANPDYKKARRLWADDSEAIDRLTNKTKLQGIAKLEGDQVENAGRMLFTNLRNSPELVKRARARIMREDPAAWDAAVRIHIEDIFNATEQSAEGGAANTAKIFNSFYRKTVGKKKQRDIIAAAMGGENTEKFKHFERFTDMLRRTALVVKKESMTAPRQAMMKEDEAGSGFIAKQLLASTKPLVTHRLVTLRKLLEFQTTRGRKLMAEAMLDPKASRNLLKIRRMGVNTEAGIRAASTFFSLILGGEFRRHGTELYESFEDFKKMNKLQKSQLMGLGELFLKGVYK